MMDEEDLCCLHEDVGEVFGIEFDSYVDEVGTVGDLYKYVLWKLGLRKREEACLCPPTFFALRQALATQTERDAKSITLNARLADLLPWWRRRTMWRRLGEDLNLEFPELRDARGAAVWAGILWVCVGIPLSVLLAVVLIDENSSDVRWLVAVGLALAIQVPIWFFLIWLSRLAQRRLPEDCGTVGELVRYLVLLNPNKLRARFTSMASVNTLHVPAIEVPQPRCTYLAAVLHVRQALIETTGYFPAPVRTNTPLAGVVGPVGRRSTWRILGLNLGWELPKLRRSRWVIAVCVLGYPAMLATQMREINDLPLLWRLAIPYWFMAYICTIPLAVHFPKNCATVGELSRAVTRLNYGRIARENDSVHPNEVWSVLRDLVAEVSGIRREDVNKDMPLRDAARTT